MERWKAVHISDVKKKKPSRCLIAEERKSLPLAEEMLRAKLKRKEVDFKQLSALYIYIYIMAALINTMAASSARLIVFLPTLAKEGQRERERMEEPSVPSGWNGCLHLWNLLHNSSRSPGHGRQ